MKAYWITVCGMTMAYRAATASRAKYLAARSCHEAGWGKTTGDVLKSAKVLRAPEHDGEPEGSVSGTFSTLRYERMGAA